MSGGALALVAGAAVLHAAWNALAKSGRNPLAFLWSSLTLASVLLGPAAAIHLLRESPAPGAWPFVGATILLHAVYFYALGRAYRSGPYSLVYPVARGLGVGLVPLVALAVFDERPSAIGVGGIGLVVAGIVGLHLAPRSSDRRGPRGPLRDLPLNRVAPAKPALEQGCPALSLGSARAAGGRDGRAATRWALLTGVTIASYSIVDKAGVARLHPVPYIALLGLGTSALLLPAVLADAPALRAEWAVNRRQILIASTMNLSAYLLVLFAFRLSKTGYVVAARELSIVLSAVIGSVWLDEGPLAPLLLGAGAVLAGVACIAAA
jgi:drug/metabolite transporter (DMT)-like permease